MSSLNVVEATIEDLQGALASGSLTSVELVALYLRRISSYDCRGPTLNSIPILNTAVFDDAAASDDRRARDPSHVRPLEGIPYTVKDSYAVRGMTAACGSPAFADLVATEDAFTVSALREAGAVLLGRTNMPPMAYGGMQRGIYGRAESPYNPDYLAAAFWSGSSNGSAVATAASFAAFGMGEETVSSGRSPASNNAVVAYTPSRGWLSIRGNWPLYMTCDVVVPHTRTMRDLLAVLNVITAEDAVKEGDFWREQPFVKLERPWHSLKDSFLDLTEGVVDLRNVRIAVPEMYIGGRTPSGASPVTTCQEVVELWEEARRDLERLGAEIVVVPDFPCVTAYENPDLLPEGCPRRPDDWHSTERGPLIAHGWNTFLQMAGDPNIPGLAAVDTSNIYPTSMRTDAELKVLDTANAIRFPQLHDYLKASSLYKVENLEQAVAALEGMRKCLLEDWLTSHRCDLVAFPSAGDVASADADVNDDSAAYAKRNGVWYSNGNRAPRHLGIPSVSVPMGIMREKKMPVNLTLAGRAYDDINLLKYAAIYEKRTQKREAPSLTPSLDSDTVLLRSPGGAQRSPRPKLEVLHSSIVKSDLERDSEIQIEGNVTISPSSGDAELSPIVEVTVDGTPLPTHHNLLEPLGPDTDGGASFHFKIKARVNASVTKDIKRQTLARVAGQQIMVVILARAAQEGYPTGWMTLL